MVQPDKFNLEASIKRMVRSHERQRGSKKWSNPRTLVDLTIPNDLLPRTGSKASKLDVLRSEALTAYIKTATALSKRPVASQQFSVPVSDIEAYAMGSSEMTAAMLHLRKVNASTRLSLQRVAPECAHVLLCL